MKHEFSTHFNDVTDDAWRVLAPGRVGRIQLRGPEGALDIYVAYFPTGSDAGPERRRIMRIVSGHMEPQQKVLSLFMGDFNFAAHPKDR